jgi:hypothetical protein
MTPGPASRLFSAAVLKITRGHINPSRRAGASARNFAQFGRLAGRHAACYARTTTMDRHAGRLLAGFLAIVLAICAVSLPAAASSFGKHVCCARMSATCPMPQLQCCVTRTPARPAQAPPPDTRIQSAPDLTASVPYALSTSPSLAIVTIGFERPQRGCAAPRLYLLHSSLLV